MLWICLLGEKFKQKSFFRCQSHQSFVYSSNRMEIIAISCPVVGGCEENRIKKKKEVHYSKRLEVFNVNKYNIPSIHFWRIINDHPHKVAHSLYSYSCSTPSSWTYSQSHSWLVSLALFSSSPSCSFFLPLVLLPLKAHPSISLTLPPVGW